MRGLCTKINKKKHIFSANCLQKPSGTQQRSWKTWRSPPAKLCHPTTFYHSEHEQKDCYWLQVCNFWLIWSENLWIDLVSRLIGLISRFIVLIDLIGNWFWIIWLVDWLTWSLYFWSRAFLLGILNIALLFLFLIRL